MANWKNLDTLKAYDELLELWNEVSVKDVMAGESGAKRVAEYNVPIAEGLTFNYAARPVDDKVLNALQALADEAELADKYKELYNGAVINTGENRLVLHQLCRGQLGDDVIADGVNKRDFYAKQQARIAEFVKKVHVSKTIFVLVSKSGTTLETLTNEAFVKNAIKEAGLDASKHMIAVTSETSPLAGNPDYLDSFYMDDYIGGRYSSSSAVGGAILSLAFGPEIFDRFLQGAAKADAAAKETDITKNAAMLDALIGVYERNVLGCDTTAVLPYSQALARFPAHLQQLDMESNGKSVNRFGEPVNYVTGPIIFGEPGTNGQHSFYQLLHQGKTIVPLQFVGFKENQMENDVVIEGSTSQQKLKANVAAQIVAFACGKDDENKNKYFEGDRPSSIIVGDKLTPESLGALLAHFENKVMFQGFVWNVNSFDQEGVQLGKLLAKKVLAGDTDGALKGYAELLDI